MGLISHWFDPLVDRLLGGVTVDPDRISYLSIVFSVFTFLVPGALLKAIYVEFILILDLFDGYFARRQGKTNPHIDYACDRASEIAIFLMSPLWLGLTAINSLITALIPKYGVLRPLPLRHLYVFWLLIIFINGFV